MNFVATSQPLEDGEENLVAGWGSVWASESSSPLPGGDRIPAGWDEEFVGSSQPFEDGEEDLKGPLTASITSYTLGSATPLPSTPAGTSSGAATGMAGRRPLVRRCSPMTPSPTAICAPSNSRPFNRYNLVRRVTTPSEMTIRAAEMERKRQSVRRKAHRIAQKLRALATDTARLQRKHRELCKLAGGTYNSNKE
ncbi:hypothetical protein B0H17DRAFT_1186949, partial [Mycena rosella]